MYVSIHDEGTCAILVIALVSRGLFNFCSIFGKWVGTIFI